MYSKVMIKSAPSMVIITTFIRLRKNDLCVNYGGDNQNVCLQQLAKAKVLGTVATQATIMSGFYDVDDSPAAQAKFLDLHTTLNRDNQKRYANTSHIAQGAIKLGK